MPLLVVWIILMFGAVYLLLWRPQQRRIAMVRELQSRLRVGDDVRHTKWGEGVILDIIGEGEKAEAVVRFPSVGEKRLLLSWAPLEKV